MLTVHKYGGTSVDGVERIKYVASHLRKTAQGGSKIVAVVSAMGQQTNELLNLAHQLSSTPTKRELDMLLSVGERSTMALLSIALDNIGIKSISLTGSQSGILTDGNHTNARISRITGERIRSALDSHDVVIVAGFQGVDPTTKEITTLGRGGSDLTAVAIAAHLNADVCEIFTDVKGLYSADPRIVPLAKHLANISWESASELSWNGAKVIQPRAVHLAEKYGIRLVKRSSFDLDSPGTLIYGSNSMESPLVTAVTSKDALELIELRGFRSHEDASIINRWLWQQGCAPQLSQQRLAESGEVSVQVLIPAELAKILDDCVKNQEFSANVVLKTMMQNLACISIIGHGFLQSPETLTQALGAVHVPVLLSEVRNSCICVCVRSADLTSSLNSIHNKFLATA